MLTTYLVGITYELPRLWIAFLPLLLLGVTADVPLLHGRTTRRALKPVMLVVIVSLVVSSWHWTLLDVRESEYRLETGRFFR